jgi:hypothetical protein
MGATVSEQDLLLISQRLRDMAGCVRGCGAFPENRDAAVEAVTASSNSCDTRYLKELLLGLVDACEALTALAP